MTTHPNTHLIIAGDGVIGQYLTEASDFWTDITFTGLLSKEKLYDFYRLADVGVVCSLHEEFGFAIEMMIHSLPVVVSGVGGLEKIVEGTFILL